MKSSSSFGAQTAQTLIALLMKACAYTGQVDSGHVGQVNSGHVGSACTESFCHEWEPPKEHDFLWILDCYRLSAWMHMSGE